MYDSEYSSPQTEESRFTPPTRSEILGSAQADAVLFAALSRWREGHITWGEAMGWAARELALENQRLRERLARTLGGGSMRTLSSDPEVKP